ncbi:TPA: BppU family phage baseplate upper protein [Bacillus cereus]|uniref:BppU family phage baseplate upper protein n=2 Tax=Bacteria TaxID=2 RepID=A0ABU8IA52_9SPHI|nr:BppU family phage baseplate upper protein [Bacillus cereus]
MYKTYTLTIDVTSQKEPPLVHFNQEDYNTAQLIVHLRNGSNILPLSGASVQIVVQKLDNNGGYLPCTITDANNGIIEVVLSSSSLAYPGQVMCEIHITKGANKLVTPRFKYVVGKSLLNPETLASTNEYPFLQQLVVDGKNAKQDFNNALLEVDKKADVAVAAVVKKAESEINSAQSQLNGIVRDAGNVVTEAKQIDMPFLKKSEDEMKGLRKVVGDTNTRMDNIVANGNKDNTEVVDARLGADGIARGSVGSLVREIHKQQLNDERKSQLLQHGVNVLNAPVASPLNIEIQGRTLVNLLGQTNLDNTKYYVFIPQKGTTKISYGGNTYEGVTKFTGQATASYSIKQDFRGKVAGSVAENGDISKVGFGNSLLNPTNLNNFPFEVEYDRINTLNGVYKTSNTISNGQFPQNVFSFNIIRTLEDKFGPQIWQGKTALADKVVIAKNIVGKFAFNWWGFGSSPSGNKATIQYWLDNQWSNLPLTNTTNTATKVSYTAAYLNRIDSNGFVHFLAYAEPSNGTVVSVINTDYVELELEVNTSLPLLEDALYEVDQVTYNKINVDPEYTGQKLLDKFPYMQGMQHLNPIVSAEGGNLIPPFTEWSFHKDTFTVGAYEMEFTVTDNSVRTNQFIIPALPNTKYNISSNSENGRIYLVSVDENLKDQMSNSVNIESNYKTGATLLTNNTTKYLRVSLTNTGNGVFKHKEPMLVLGDKQKPFAPRNPSYLYTNTSLSGFNGVNDVLYQDDGQWKLLRKWGDEQLSDKEWNFIQAYAGFKRFACRQSLIPNRKGIVLKYNNAVLTLGNTSLAPDVWDDDTVNLKISASNTDTGFSDNFNPNGDEIRAYFNGWKVKTTDANGKPIAWKSVVDDKDAPTQTLAYVKANRAPNYTPYKLTYQLATPRVEAVIVEGDFAVSGMTQVSVDSGVIVREKVKPKLNATGFNYHLNDTRDSETIFKSKNLLIINIYKNGVIDTQNWKIAKDTFAYGTYFAYQSKNTFDPTAEYTVTYLVQDKHQFTTNPINVKAAFNQSIRSTIDEVTIKQSDAATNISILQNIMTDVLARLKANSL